MTRQQPPKITIVTPSFNHGRFIEETIQSVIQQKYRCFEYLVIDGGSKDSTIDILRRYDQCIDFWVSEPDKGQAHAINKGFARAQGEILAWLNSDDTYESDVFGQVVELFDRHPDLDVISGQCRLWYGDRRDKLMDPSPLRKLEDFLKIGSGWMNDRLIVQPEAFFRRSALEKVGMLREDVVCFDVCLWIEMARAGCLFHSVNQHWANLRMHAGQKTTDLNGVYGELVRAAWKYLLSEWERLGSSQTCDIADDLFMALSRVQEQDRLSLHSVNESTSYRLGRLVTRLKNWSW